MRTIQKLVLSSLPVFGYLAYVLWAQSLSAARRLPDPLATHWGIAGVPDGFASLETHLAWAGLSFLITGLIWLGILWYPKIPGAIRLILLGISGVLYVILAMIQISALAVQVDLSDATHSRFELPVLVIFVPIAAMVLIFLAKPRIQIADQLTISLRGIPMFRTSYDRLTNVAVVDANWKEFGGLGLRVSGGRIAFLPNSGPAVEIRTAAGETILVRSDSAEAVATEMRARMGQ